MANREAASVEVPSSTTTSHARAEYVPAKVRHGVGLCLSGGGSRAALFELGALRRLNELGVLSRVDTISAVSGGSILAAHLAATMSPWPAPGTVYPDFERRVVRPFEAFVRRNLRTGALARRVLLPWNWLRESTEIRALTRLFERYLIDARLMDLPRAPERPQYVFCATDNAFGVAWTMTAERVGSYQAGYASTPPDWSLARAVAASSCFPPIFGPMPIGLDAGELGGGRHTGEGRDRLVEGLRLSDGGLYDNLALEPVWKSHAVVIAVDGGSTFDAGADQGLIWRLKRYAAIIGRQATAIRKRWLIASYITGRMRGAYLGIGSDVGSYETGGPGYSKTLVDEVISEVRSDLDAFTEAEIRVLQNHGYLLAQAAAVKHLSAVLEIPDQELRIPYPDAMVEADVRAALADSHKVRLPFGRGRWVSYLFQR